MVTYPPVSRCDQISRTWASVSFAFAPSASADSVDLKVDPPLASIGVGAPPRLGGGECGDWRAVVRAVADAGADAIEVGIPFSDPVMDGVTIQAASAQALAEGATPIGIIAEAARQRQQLARDLLDGTVGLLDQDKDLTHDFSSLSRAALLG